MHRAQPRRQQPLAGQHELVARDDVVKGQHAGEQAGEQQDVDDIAPEGPHGGTGGVQQHVAVTVEGLLRDAGDLVRTDRDDEGPHGDRVEGSDDQHRGVGGAGDGALRVARLVAEHRCRLEADETRQREQDGDTDGALAEHSRVE